MKQIIRYINTCRKCGNTCIPITVSVFQDVIEKDNKNSLIKFNEIYTMRCRCGNISTAHTLNSVIKNWNKINSNEE